jgi:hypothetical protein
MSILGPSKHEATVDERIAMAVVILFVKRVFDDAGQEDPKLRTAINHIGTYLERTKPPKTTGPGGAV